MIAKCIVLSNTTSVASDSILRICIPETLLILKKIIILLHNSLLIRYKVYSSDSRECLHTQAEGMVKPIKTLVSLLIHHHVERVL